MKRIILGLAMLALTGSSAYAGGATSFSATAGSGLTFPAFTCFSSMLCPMTVLVDNTGTEKATAGNPLRIDPVGTTAQPVTGAASSYAVGSFVDGAIATLGTEADAAWSGSGSATQIALLKAIWVLENNALLPSGTLTSGTAPTAGIATLCQYNTSAPTPTNTQTVGIGCDSNGYLNVDVKAGGANAAASATGSAVPASAGYGGVNIGGTLRGITGVNPSGSVYAPQTDLTSINGTTVLTGTGASGAGSPRMVLSTDSTVGLQAGSQIVGKVGIDQTTAGTTNAVSLAQIGANTVSTGNGVSGSATLRFNIASDNSAVSGFGVAATGGAVPANAIYNGANVGGNLTGKIACGSSIVYDASTNGSTQLVALSSGKTVYVCGYTLFAAGTVSVNLSYGTGSACASGTTKLTPAYQLVAQTGVSDQSPEFRGMATAASNELCLNTSAGVAVQAVVYYTQF
jgi:hypothetical protein